MAVTAINRETDVYSPFSDPVSLAKVFTEPPDPIPWLVKDRVQLARGGLITGIGGSSKTRFLYHLAIGSVVGALPWDWRVEKTGKAILVLTEDTHDDVHRTMYEIGTSLGLTETQQRTALDGLVVFALAGNDMLLVARNDRGSLSKTPRFEELRTLIDVLGDVVFVGIDPALSITEGDEYSQADQRALGKMADDLAVNTGATVMLVSHSPKGSQQVDELSSHNSRGGGAITDAVRMEYALRTMTAAEAQKSGITDPEERRRHVQLVATKGNHLPPAAFVPTWLRRGAHGVLGAAEIATAESGAPNPQDLKALDILRELARAESPKLEDWRDRCEEEGLLKQKNIEARRKAMGRIVSRLQDAGLVERGFGRGIYQPVTES